MVAGLAIVAFGCTTGGGGTTTTTTASTTTTTSTTSTTINPACGSYTPTAVTSSDPSASPGDTITVSGSAPTDGIVIQISMTPVGAGTATGVITTATVAGGAYSAAVVIPNTVTVGQWNIVANATGCGGTATTLIDIV
jgi:hypothetical protein